MQTPSCGKVCCVMKAATAAAAAKLLQSCPTLCAPSLGFSRQEHWSGLPFPLQCMKVKRERSRLVVSDSLQPHGLQPTRLLRPWDFPGKSTGVGCHCPLRVMEAVLCNQLSSIQPPLSSSDGALEGVGLGLGFLLFLGAGHQSIFPP